MKDTIVMLFHTRDAADSFIDRLKDHDFSSNDIMLVGPDDLPQFGRGEHAAAGGGIMDRIASFFGVEDEERKAERRYTSLSDYLESRGLSRTEADHYENEVRADNYMVGVKAGDRYSEVQDLAHGGVSYGSREFAASGRTDLDYDRDVDLGARSDIDRGRLADERTMELHEEVLQPGATEVRTGEAEIGKRVVEEQKTVDVPVRHEELYIERRPVAKEEAPGVDIGESAQESISIPLSEERPTVEKKLVTSEEVAAGKREAEETERITGAIRREEPDISEEELRGLSEEERRRIMDERRRRAA